MDVSTSVDLETGDVLVVASYRMERGEVAVYQVRVPRSDIATEDGGKRKIQDATTIATTRLRRMLDAYHSGH